MARTYRCPNCKTEYKISSAGEFALQHPDKYPLFSDDGKSRNRLTCHSCGYDIDTYALAKGEYDVVPLWKFWKKPSKKAKPP